MMLLIYLILYFIESFNVSETSTNRSTQQSTLIEHEKGRKFFFKTHSQGRLRWDLFIIFLATFNCFQVPYNLAFTNLEDSNVFLDVINVFLDVFFIIDVFVNFRTSFIIDATGEEVTDLKAIAVQYVKGRFWIDLISSIPIDLFTLFLDSGKNDSATFQLFSLFKLLRVLRLSRIITYINIKNELKMSLKL